MEITVLSDEENPMLHRRDVRFRVSHVEATPDRLAVRDSLAARLNKSADEVVIRRLDTKFGMRETIGDAKVYEGPEQAQDIEQDYMLVRNKIGVEDGEAPATEAEPEGEEEEAEPEGEEEEAEPEGEEEEAEDEEAADDGDADDAADDAGDEPEADDETADADDDAADEAGDGDDADAEDEE